MNTTSYNDGTRPIHTVPYVAAAPGLMARWDDPAWRDCRPLDIQHFHRQSGDHHPRTAAKLCFDATDLFVLFKVEDRYVISRNTEAGSPVYEDSCVEAFLQPGPNTGYVNIEINAGGTVLASHITDPTRVPGGFAAYRAIPAAKVHQIQTCSTLPRTVLSEMMEPILWQMSVRIPFSLMAEFTSAPPPRSGTRWGANFFKCADKSSHPHWGAWSPIAEELNFHRPDCFGTLQFE